MLDCKNLGIGFSCAISHANDNYFRAMKTEARSTFSKQNTYSSFIGHFSNQGKIVVRNSLYNSPGKLKIKGFFMGFFFGGVPCLPPYNLCSTFKPKLFHMVIQFLGACSKALLQET